MANTDNKITVSGQWKSLADENPSVTVGGQWKDLSEGYVTVNNQWEQWWTPPTPQELWAVGGYNAFGQLGLGDIVNRSSPVQIGSLTNWDKIAFNEHHAMHAIKTDGTLWAWGSGEYGQLGLGDLLSKSSPVQVGSLTDWDKITGGQDHAAAIKTDGTLWTWGRNRYGELGIGGEVAFDKKISSPVQVGSLTNWSGVYGGEYYTVAMKTDGTLWSWGNNSVGQLGLGTNNNSISSPVQVGSLTNWTKVSTGYFHTVSVRTDGTLWTWGANAFGTLGLGDTVYRSSPVQVGSLTNWSKVICGNFNTIGIKTDGTLWTWGLNWDGELGLGDQVVRSSPVQVGALTDWDKAASGSSSTAAIKTDGTLWTWGNNDLGTLGLGDTTDRNSPVQVGSLTTWNKVVVGWNFIIAMKG